MRGVGRGGVRGSLLWRRARTGFAFVCFGLGVLVLGIGLSAIRLLAPESQRVDAWAQWVLHRSCRSYLAFAEALGLIRVEVHGAAALSQPGPLLVAANHPCLLDSVLMLAQLPRAVFIASTRRTDDLFLRWPALAAGYIRSDGGPAVVREAVRRLGEGQCIVIFPEGTRSPRQGLAPFRRGAAHIALASGCPLQPVTISCDPPALLKGQKWYDVPDRTIHFTIRVAEPIRCDSGRCAGPEPDPNRRPDRISKGVAARRLTAELRETISKGLSCG
jgi:1-acyl-sn-glycerol-3-phosphate acyltransferase